MRQKNLFVIVVLPTFFMLDKYPALYRARGLFHIYEMKDGKRCWVYYNQKNKLKLYLKGKKEFNYNCMKYPGFRGRFFDQYTLNEASYKGKKLQSFKKRTRITRAEFYMEERNKMLWLLHKELKAGAPKLAKLLKQYEVSLKVTHIGEILAKERGIQREIADTT